MFARSTGFRMQALCRQLLAYLSASIVLVFAAASTQPAFAQTATTTTLAVTSGGSAATTVSAGTVVTLTATVTAGSTPVTPGQVEFCDASVNYCTDIHQLGVAQLTKNGTAVYKFRPGGGSHSYKAVFLGTKTYTKSSSSASSLDITGPFISTTQLQQSYQGDSWNLTALVTGSSSTPSLAAPSGAVSFIDSSNSNNVVGIGDLAGGALSTSFAGAGNELGGSAIAIADFNSDGIPDLALRNGTSITVWFGNGNGTFIQGPSFTPNPPPSTTFSSSSILVADFNSDGIPDLALVDSNDQDMIIMLGKGDGTFTQKTVISNSVAGGASLNSVAIGDFNRDGIPDMVMTGGVSGANYAVYILSGNGDGTFAAEATSIALPDIPSYSDAGVQVADFNGDGILDLLIGPFSNSPTSPPMAIVLLGNGDGTFTQKAGVPLVSQLGPEVRGVVIADFTGDGIPDLAVWTVYDYAIQILPGNGDGSFSFEPSFPVDIEGIGFTLGDFNGDGIADLAVDTFGGSFYAYLGNGDGTFTTQSTNLANTPVSTEGVISAGDLNGDGLWDLIGFNNNASYSIFLAQSGWTTSATLTNFTPSAGTHVIVATYPGDSNYLGSTSGAVTLRTEPPILTGEYPTQNSSGSITFLWTAGTGVSAYELKAGTTGAGSSDLYAGSPTTSTSVTVTGIPLNGATVYLTLLYEIDGTWYSAAEQTYQESKPAVLTSPTPGSKLSGTSATFQWTSGIGVSDYLLTVGSKGSGSSDIFSSWPIPSGSVTPTSIVVPGIPTDGLTLYVTLQSQINGVWYTSNYTYTEAPPTPPALITPTPGSKLSGSTATFQWSPGSGPSAYLLNVGTKWPGSDDIYGSGATTATSATVSGLPTDGVNVYVLLRYYLNGVWTDLNYTYTAEGSTAPPVMTTPSPGSVLSGSNVTFQWTAGTGVTAYALSVGTYGPGYYNIYSSPQLSTTSVTVPGIPTDSKPVYITLLYQINGVWSSAYYTYTAAPLANPPVMTSPASSSVLPGSSVTFNWTPGTGVTAYALSVGTYGPGYYNIYGSPQLSTTSVTVPNIPTDSKPVYVTLHYLVDGLSWQTASYTYTAAPLANPPVMTSPTPGTVLPGSTVTFQWTPSSGAYAYSLSVGTYGPGYFNVYSSPSTTGTSLTVPNIPTNGKPVYVTLNYEIPGGTWEQIYYTYTAQ